jgi:hypothetical protein
VFGKRKDPKLEGPYKVEKATSDTVLETLLNQRHNEGYEAVQILQNLWNGQNMGRSVVFRMRS